MVEKKLKSQKKIIEFDEDESLEIINVVKEVELLQNNIAIYIKGLLKGKKEKIKKWIVKEIKNNKVIIEVDE